MDPRRRSRPTEPRSRPPDDWDIAQRMFLAEKTVKDYVSSLLAKLGRQRRTQAAVLASKLLGKAQNRHSPHQGRAAGLPVRESV